jgi:pentatricopeptide repeat protein
MIDAYSKNGQAEKAIEMFVSMKKRPNFVTYCLMIDVYKRVGKSAIELFASMKKKGPEPDIIAYNSMIDAYSKFALLKKKGIKPDVWAFSALLNCYAKSGKHIDDLLYVLEEMNESSIVPNSYNYNGRIWSSRW